jgi:tetratricopeptide (TPR) repeat protein
MMDSKTFLHTIKKLYRVFTKVSRSDRSGLQYIALRFVTSSFNPSWFFDMKSSLRFFVGCTLALGLSGSLSSVSASTSGNSATEYSYKALGSPIALKWPRGSLIFPEKNNPNRTNEVFLLNEAFTSKSELQFLHQHLGLQLFSRKKYSQAKKEYLKALRLEPNVPVIHKNLGLIYFNSRNYKRAEKAYRKALQLNPGYTPALAKLALSLAAQKKYTSAERKFKQAIQAEPSNAEHYLNLGHFYYYLKKNYRGAKSVYKKALKLNSRLVKAKINLRDINLKFRKSKDKESDFESSWGSDFDYDNFKSTENLEIAPSYPEETDISDALDAQNPQPPLF